MATKLARKANSVDNGPCFQTMVRAKTIIVLVRERSCCEWARSRVTLASGKWRRLCHQETRESSDIPGFAG